jgi:hypothetical protein
MAFGPLGPTSGRDVDTQLVSPGRQRERTVDPCRRPAFGDEPVREREGQPGGPLARAVGLVERAEGAIHGVELAVEPRRVQFGQR